MTMTTPSHERALHHHHHQHHHYECLENSFHFSELERPEEEEEEAEEEADEPTTIHANKLARQHLAHQQERAFKEMQRRLKSSSEDGVNGKNHKHKKNKNNNSSSLSGSESINDMFGLFDWASPKTAKKKHISVRADILKELGKVPLEDVEESPDARSTNSTKTWHGTTKKLKLPHEELVRLNLLPGSRSGGEGGDETQSLKSSKSHTKRRRAKQRRELMLPGLNETEAEVDESNNDTRSMKSSKSHTHHHRHHHHHRRQRRHKKKVDKLPSQGRSFTDGEDEPDFRPMKSSKSHNKLPQDSRKKKTKKSRSVQTM